MIHILSIQQNNLTSFQSTSSTHSSTCELVYDLQQNSSFYTILVMAFSNASEILFGNVGLCQW